MRPRAPVVLMIYMVVACGFCATLFGDQPSPARSELKDSEAVHTLEVYSGAERTARAAYQKSVDQARSKALDSLNVVKGKLTKAGNLDEAVKIRDAIESLGHGTDPAAAPAATDSRLAARLPNTKWKKVKGGWVMTFHNDMSVTSTHHNASGCWAAVDKDSIRFSISMNTCASDVFKISADGAGLANSKGELDFTLVP